MLSKSNEKRLYTLIYHLAFGKDKSFFYDNDSQSIYAFLIENYWGDGLALRIKLLAKLLYFDSFVNPLKIKKDLMKKSEELNKYLNQNSG
ncbi:hypothetical protein FACS1894177_08660 [Bacteroidia bacterium]|nr:hypothetical protein FACS1894177_08660 [Bacteroidia bacterium]